MTSAPVRLEFPPKERIGMTESQAAGIVAHMPEFDLTILYDQGEDGWIVASIPAVPGALSQGRPVPRPERTFSMPWR